VCLWFQCCSTYFHRLFGHLHFIFEEMPIQVLQPFLNLFMPLLEVFIDTRYKLLVIYMLCKYIPRLSFYSHHSVFWSTKVFFLIFVSLFVFWDRVLLCAPGCPWIHNLLSSASLVLGLQVSATWPQLKINLMKSYSLSFCNF
jgi:hypothetical protein